MSETPKIVRHMFVNLAKLPLDEKVARQASSVVDGLIEKMQAELSSISKADWHKLRIAFCGMLAHGWAMGMHPFNNPRAKADGTPLEVRVSRDILLPIEALQSLRYIKKDNLGRIEKAFFEPSPEVKVKEQIDRILSEIAKKHWAK
jgi:hypothetical protein